MSEATTHPLPDDSIAVSAVEWCRTHEAPARSRFTAAVCPNDAGCEVELLQPRAAAFLTLTGRPLADFRPVDFMLWISERWRAWADEHGTTGPYYRPMTDEDHASFDRWLARQQHPSVSTEAPR